MMPPPYRTLSSILGVDATLLSATVRHNVDRSIMSTPGVDREMMKTLMVCATTTVCVWGGATSTTAVAV